MNSSSEQELKYPQNQLLNRDQALQPHPSFFAKILLLSRGVTVVLPPVSPMARICFANELLGLIKENRLFMPHGVLDGFLQPGGNQALQNPQILALRNADTSTNPQLPKSTWSGSSTACSEQ